MAAVQLFRASWAWSFISSAVSVSSFKRTLIDLLIWLAANGMLLSTICSIFGCRGLINLPLK